MQDKPRYTYEPRYGRWAVIEWEYRGTLSIGTKIQENLTKDEARKEAYRLNGWTLKPNLKPV